MRRLGQRHAYEPQVGLTRAVHDDYHEFTNIVRAQILRAHSVERTTDRGDVLPAGPEGASVVRPGNWKWRGDQFPRPHVLREIEAGSWRARAVATVEAAAGYLAEYEAHGETLDQLVRWVCFEGEARFVRRRGWRHWGSDYRAAAEMFGSDTQMWAALTDAWGLLAVLSVPAAVLRRAEDAGAVDAVALAWARQRGLAGTDLDEDEGGEG